ncbi:hypothetical protein [Mycolicibacterium aichiense]|uniref:Uncharacterized protein n=1 Tax=Mycolicibacterium aichiense TaxID=1799 RepID=A0AAD1HMK8_9MYCO|nr:hypothetical protein [Mycolicibacterium aichiense]MCV7017639.1 hypothetical protein [Mycolicibacterium aichiense]BBX06756.1 hypothetical protein MAIC_15590 [Mycolicibacterium aichiense]STZ80573.1 Uncharacterised protein [Mycolicibacterium aichiense]
MQSKKPWRPTPKLEEIAAVVARVELIPADRPLTAGEIRMLDSLAARLRRRSLNDRSDGLLDLLRRVSAVRTSNREAGVSVPAAKNSANNGREGLGHIHRELSELAAKHPLGPEGLGRLQAIVNDTARLAEKGPSYQRLYERALQIQKNALRPAQQKGPRGKARGLVQNPELLYGGREVLGGAPSTGRRR